MLLPGLSATRASMTMVSPICTGWMFHGNCITNSEQVSNSICIPKLHGTWQNAAYWSPTLPKGSICSLPVVMSCSYHVTGVWCLVSGLYGCPAQWSELAIRYSLQFDTSFWQFSAWLKNFLFSQSSDIHSVLGTLLHKFTTDIDMLWVMASCRLWCLLNSLQWSSLI